MIQQLEVENIYDNYFFKQKKSYKKKYCCIGFMFLLIGYGSGILTCKLCDIC